MSTFLNGNQLTSCSNSDRPNRKNCTPAARFHAEMQSLDVFFSKKNIQTIFMTMSNQNMCTHDLAISTYEAIFFGFFSKLSIMKISISSKFKMQIVSSFVFKLLSHFFLYAVLN